MYASTFEYSITRPYPFRWFTPATIAGGLVTLVIFSLLNLGTTGYDIVTVYTAHPNKTLSLSGSLFSWGLQDAVKPECNENIIPVYAQFTTNNSALTYIVAGIQQLSEGITQPYFNYLNNLLEDCTVNGIAVNLASFERPAIQRAVSVWGAVVSADVTCFARTTGGLIQVQLSASYDIGAIGSTAVSPSPWPGRNATTKSSLYWGETLMDLYWRKLVIDASNSTQQGNLTWYQGNVALLLSQNTTEVTSPDFSAPPRCFFYTWPDASGSSHESYCQTNASNPTTSFSQLLSGQKYPRGGGLQIWASLDNLAKTFYSSIMVDLGRSTPSPNFLVNSTLLQLYTANITELYALPLTLPVAAGLATQPFDPSNHTPGYPQNLSLRPSTIMSKYSCQQRKWKSPSALIVSTLVANVAFLSATWKVFNWIVSSFVKRRLPGAKVCSGCLQLTRKQHEYNEEQMPAFRNCY